MTEVEQCRFWDLPDAERDTYWLGVYMGSALEFFMWVFLFALFAYIAGGGAVWASRQYRGERK